MDKQVETKQPLGVTVLGRINLFVFGAGSFLLSLLFYVSNNSASTESLLEELSKYFPEGSVNAAQLKSIFVIHMVIAAFFAVTGFGLIRKKGWARKATLYFSFFAVVMIFMAAAMNTAFISQAMVQIIYPAILIIYFTNKNVEHYFVSSKINKTDNDAEAANSEVEKP